MTELETMTPEETTEKKEKTTDPRTHVTPDAFGVADELLGRELATPWRRGLALLIDLIVIFALTKAGGLTFATILALAAFWLIVRLAKGWKSALLLGTLALPAALLVFSVTLPFVMDIHFGPSPSQWQEFGEAMQSDDPKIREAAILELEESYETAYEDFDQLPGINQLSGIDTAFGRDEDATEDEREEARRQLVRDYAKVTRENQELRQRLDEPSLIYLAQAVAGDLGLTVGWTGLYFTLVPAYWHGRTVGKFLLRLRIVRLDHTPLRVWTAFERFAGYAAGLATGLLGFLQIFWDANRQGVQDKIVGTVVVRER